MKPPDTVELPLAKELEFDVGKGADDVVVKIPSVKLLEVSVEVGAGNVTVTWVVILMVVAVSLMPLAVELVFAGTGGLVVAAYAIGVLMLRIPSRVTFLLAALALAGIGIELLLLPAPGRANNGALLVFLLLGVALVSSVLETRRLESKNKLSRRR